MQTLVQSLLGRSTTPKASNLQSRVQEEKIFGLPTNRDPDAPTNRIHYFKEVYLLVEEYSGCYRPIHIKEYENNEREEGEIYPRLYYPGPSLRCPFLPVPSDMQFYSELDSNREKRLHSSCDEERDIGIDQVKQPSANSRIASGIHNKTTSARPDIRRHAPIPARLEKRIPVYNYPRPEQKEIMSSAPAKKYKFKAKALYKKPGYCENCAIKYQDFDTVSSRFIK